MHSYRQPGTEEGEPIREQANQTLGVGVQDDQGSNRPTEVYEKFNPVLHAGMTIETGRGRNKQIYPISMAFIKKYIQYAKSRIKPILSKDAGQYIVSAYASLRNDDMESNMRRTSPITARTLETLIRLSTAHAKARLSNEVTVNDAKQAYAILRFALFKEMPEKEDRRKRRRTANVDSSEETDASDNSDGSNDSDGDQPSTSRRRGQASRRSALARGSQRSRRTTNTQRRTIDEDDEDGTEEDTQPTTNGASSSAPHRTNRTVSTTGTESQLSRMSIASSLPSSQLPPTQTDTQTDTQDSLPQSEPQPTISTPRYNIFRSALGQLTSTSLFQNDMAKVDDLLEAINANIEVDTPDEDEFEKEEAVLALQKLADANAIMFLPDEEEVYRL